MVVVIDCGTTNSRIYVVSAENKIIASGTREIGVRDTTITGSKDVLKTGIEKLYTDTLRENNIRSNDIDYVVASGMITSEIGLIEIPHLVAPAGIEELAKNIMIVTDPNVIDIGIPVYFIRGVRNNYGENATIKDLQKIDFLRGEEVQCIGILNELKPSLPLNVVVLSSHTKIIHLDQRGKITNCMSTISGQFYNALKEATSVGKSIVSLENETGTGLSFEEIVEAAERCVEHAGLSRAMLMPRFMQVLLKTNGHDRKLFVNAAIAADDMKAFQEYMSRGYDTQNYLFFGHESRCKLYNYLVKQKFGYGLKTQSVFEKETIANLTVKGSIEVIRRI